MPSQNCDLLQSSGDKFLPAFPAETGKHPHVEAGKNTSAVIPASRKRRWKGNPVVWDKTVIYGYESSATLTTDWLHYKLQTCPLIRGHPKMKSKAIFRQKKGKSKICSWVPKGYPTPRRIDWLTVSRKVTLTSTTEGQNSCGCELEYLHHSPASCKKQCKGNPVPEGITGPSGS
jgi:hypothetical protein